MLWTARRVALHNFRSVVLGACFDIVPACGGNCVFGLLYSVKYHDFQYPAQRKTRFFTGGLQRTGRSCYFDGFAGFRVNFVFSRVFYDIYHRCCVLGMFCMACLTVAAGQAKSRRYKLKALAKTLVRDPFSLWISLVLGSRIFGQLHTKRRQNFQRRFSRETEPFFSRSES